MAGGKLEGSHNTRVDCEPEVAMAGLKQELLLGLLNSVDKDRMLRGLPSSLPPPEPPAGCRAPGNCGVPQHT